MPYEWLPATPTETRLHLWPYRSLPKTGFVWFIGGTATLLLVPLLAVLGSPVLWGLLPFLLLALAAVWFALNRSYRDGEIVEHLTLTPDRITLTRHGPRGRRQDWQANPYWVRLDLHRTGGPVPNYLTLQGGDRQVELGAFLAEDERLALLGELNAALRRCRSPER
ncbi:DUF2244 domain-containing protein [Fertoebacter nigrum]|uniref:DUF2244 domain-containing protein n=1 Tax=Fertoeibacter niger TaxID=2656921 RepID=A0A8X8KNK2_9RHOB|nr:DUF2244 domain-containing protein [Fertoeibacter niger]NUB43881.1 DUF2244 domain-containing protein [Fertoeibacter niger]